jgi:hypothetical protein
MFRHHWERVGARIVDVDFDDESQPYALYIVELHPVGEPSFRAEVASPPFGHYSYPPTGALPVLYDQQRNKVKIDTSRLVRHKQRRRADRT